MPHLDTALDVVIKDDGCCTQCGAPISALVLGGLCAACATKALEPPEPVATETQIEARRALARRELARRHLIPYIQYQMPNYHAGWVHWDIAARLERFLKQVIRGESPRLILDMPPRHGKLCADSTPVLTTRGWATHGALRAGDEVFGPDGYPTRVLAVHAPDLATLEVVTTDGAAVKVHPAHEWTVYDRSSRKWRTLETQELAARTLWSGPRNSRGGRAVFQLPKRRRIQLPAQDLPLHPYFFGVWLGDGRAAHADFCYADRDECVLEAVTACGYAPSWGTRHKATGVNYVGFRGVTPILRMLGVLGDKHLPDIYKLGSVEQREQLLAGLIDTDGHVERKTGRVRIATVSDRLAADIEDLVRSLGWRANRYAQTPALSSSGIQGRSPVHYVSFTPDRALPTRGARKAVRGNPRAQRRGIGIAEVRAVSPEKGRCITVDRPDGLYLVGRELIPTHNSLAVSQFFPGWALGQHPWLEFIVASHTASLAVDFSRKVRAQVEDPAYPLVFDKTRVDPDNRNAMGWKTTDGGGYLPAGVGGAITGRGAHILTIDDFLKNRDDARSAVIREGHWQWYSSTAYTRLAPGGGVLVIACMTGDTPVTLGDGTRKRLEEIRPGDEVLAWKDGVQVTRRVLNWAAQGEDEVFEIRTGNHRVRANARHPFLVRRSGGHEWVRVQDLGVGDLLVGTGVLPGRAPVMLSDDEAWLLGFMFGDGWVTTNKKRSWNRDRTKSYETASLVTCVAKTMSPTIFKRGVNERVLGLFERVLGVRLKDTQFGYYRTEVARVGRWFLERGLAGGAKGKRLPAWLFNQPRGTRLAFLSGFSAADGYFDAHARIQIKLANGLLVEDLRQLARDVGYRPTNVYARTERVQPPHSAAVLAAESWHVGWGTTELVNEAFTAAAIRSIVPAGRAAVYDIQVEDAECFVADGLVTHNTRWHDDDLVGRLIAKMRDEDEPGDQFEIVKYPAIAEHDEYRLPSGKLISLPAEGAKLLRKKGEALHPERWPLERLLKIKAAVTPDDWAALYQQDPQASTSAIFTPDMVRYYDPAELPKRLVYYTFWDLAIGQKQTNDWTVGTTVGVDEQDNIWVVNVQRGRWDAMEIVDRMIDTYRTYHEDMIGVEKGHISMAIGPFLQKRIDESPDAKGMGFFEVPTGNRDKVARSRSIQGRMKQGKVRYPRQAPWLKGHLDELFAFDKGKFDDQVDSLSGIGIMLDEMVQPGAPKKAGEPEWMKKVLQRMARTASSGRDWRAA